MDVQITRPLQRAVHRDLICQCLFLCGDLHPSNASTSLHPSLHLDHFSRCEGLADRDQQTDRHTDHATLSVAISCIQLVLQCDLNAIQANNAKHSNYLNRQSMIKHTHTHHLMALCLGLPGWAGTKRNIHPLTPILIVRHPLSTFSIYYDP